MKILNVKTKNELGPNFYILKGLHPPFLRVFIL